MFNHIRKVPYVAGDGKGGISYFAGGFQNQFGLETQIVAAMCKSPQLFFLSQTLTVTRCHPCFCNHLSCSQGPTYDRPSCSRCCYTCLGSCHVRHVQLPPQHFPHQERRLPLLAASLLDALMHSAVLLSGSYDCGKLSYEGAAIPLSPIIQKVPLDISRIDESHPSNFIIL
jgi:hypothetical protein